MPAKAKGSVPEIYQLKVTLLRTHPPIWRRLLVPSDMTLAKLHGVLQVAMGWDDSHLHAFESGGQTYEAPDPPGAGWGPQNSRDESKVRLHQVLGRVGAKALYTYDFGDGWEHAIVLEI
jgi:hypothetical protein